MSKLFWFVIILLTLIGLGYVIEQVLDIDIKGKVTAKKS